MDREEAIEELRACVRGDDPERDHYRADEVLCELLDSLGYEDVVAEYQKVNRWYA